MTILNLGMPNESYVLGIIQFGDNISNNIYFFSPQLAYLFHFYSNLDIMSLYIWEFRSMFLYYI